MDSTDRERIVETNRKAWDRLVEKNSVFTTPAKNEDLRNPVEAIDGLGWLEGSLKNKRVLCLAAGGGRQSALYASAGASVTVLDISPAMLELDRQVAQERKLDIVAIEGSMDDLTMLPAQSFDLVIQPVSSCYLPNIRAIYQQVARVTRANGIYISQHKTPQSLQSTLAVNSHGKYELAEPYYRNTPLPPSTSKSILREEGTLEFLHRWEELIGGLCRAGFVVEDLIEPFHVNPNADIGDFGHRAQYIAPYVRIKARRVGNSDSSGGKIWLP